MSEVEKLAAQVESHAHYAIERHVLASPAEPNLVGVGAAALDIADFVTSALQSQARRVEELEAALRKIASGGLGSFGQRPADIARSALSEGSGSSRELAPPDESGDACGATERAEGAICDAADCVDRLWCLQRSLCKRKPELCSDCPPVGYPTDETRCLPCPRWQFRLDRESSRAASTNTKTENNDG